MSDNTGGRQQQPASTSNRTFNGPKPPLKLKQIWSIRTRLNLAEPVWDAALFDLLLIAN
jgi:hypothetical protein